MASHEGNARVAPTPSCSASLAIPRIWRQPLRDLRRGLQKPWEMPACRQRDEGIGLTRRVPRRRIMASAADPVAGSTEETWPASFLPPDPLADHFQPLATGELGISLRHRYKSGHWSKHESRSCSADRSRYIHRIKIQLRPGSAGSVSGPGGYPWPVPLPIEPRSSDQSVAGDRGTAIAISLPHGRLALLHDYPERCRAAKRS